MSENFKKPSVSQNDIVRMHGFLRAGPIQITAYRVTEPNSGGLSTMQFQMVYDNTVLAVMSQEAARLFSGFVDKTFHEMRDGAPL